MIFEGPARSVLTPAVSSSWFEKVRDWIIMEVKQSHGKWGALRGYYSHHTTSFFRTSPSDYPDPFLHFCDEDFASPRWATCCFSSNSESLFQSFGHPGNSTIKLWAFGHNHFTHDQVEHDTRLVSNQRGYLRSMNSDYSPRFVVFVS